MKSSFFFFQFDIEDKLGYRNWERQIERYLSYSSVCLVKSVYIYFLLISLPLNQLSNCVFSFNNSQLTFHFWILEKTLRHVSSTLKSSLKQFFSTYVISLFETIWADECMNGYKQGKRKADWIRGWNLETQPFTHPHLVSHSHSFASSS